MDVTSVFGVGLFAVLFLVGVPGNTLIIWVFARKPRKTNTKWLIISLATVDLTACLIAPVNLIRAFGGEFIIPSICKISIFGSRALSFSSLYLTTCIALDRHRSICRPFKKRPKSHRVFIAIISCLVLAFSGNVQYALFVRTFEIGPISKCIYRGGPDWLDVSNEIYTSISYVVGLIICSVAYTKIYLAIRKQMKVRAALGGSGHDPGLFARNPNTDLIVRRHQQLTLGNISTDADIVTAEVTPAPHSIEVVFGESVPNGKPPNALSADLLANNNVQPNLAVQSLQLPEERYDAAESHRHVAATSNASGIGSPSAPFAEFSTLQSSVLDDTPPVAGAPYGRIEPNKHRQRKERLMTRMLLATYLILIFTWLPSFVLTNVPDAQVAAFRAKLSQGIVVYVSYQLRTINHIVSIFVFALLNENFRKDCQNIFSRFARMVQR